MLPSEVKLYSSDSSFIPNPSYNDDTDIVLMELGCGIRSSVATSGLNAQYSLTNVFVYDDKHDVSSIDPDSNQHIIFDRPRTSLASTIPMNATPLNKITSLPLMSMDVERINNEHLLHKSSYSSSTYSSSTEVNQEAQFNSNNINSNTQFECFDNSVILQGRGGDESEYSLSRFSLRCDPPAWLAYSINSPPPKCSSFTQSKKVFVENGSQEIYSEHPYATSFISSNLKTYLNRNFRNSTSKFSLSSEMDPLITQSSKNPPLICKRTQNPNYKCQSQFYHSSNHLNRNNQYACTPSIPFPRARNQKSDERCTLHLVPSHFEVDHSVEVTQSSTNSENFEEICRSHRFANRMPRWPVSSPSMTTTCDSPLMVYRPQLRCPKSTDKSADSSVLYSFERGKIILVEESLIHSKFALPAHMFQAQKEDLKKNTCC